MINIVILMLNALFIFGFGHYYVHVLFKIKFNYKLLNFRIHMLKYVCSYLDDYKYY